MITIIIPYFNGQLSIKATLAGIPLDIPVIIVDDLSDAPYQTNRQNTSVIRMARKGYFSGAVNAGIIACSTDVLILNQDVSLTGSKWLDLLNQPYDLIGECIQADHPAYPAGYIHGTFMFIRRAVIDKIGLLNEADYPLWGSTCEYQLRAARADFKILPVKNVPGFEHKRHGNYGDSIKTILNREPGKREQLIRTPPEISILVPCYNQGRFLPDLVASLVGGQSSLGMMGQQTFASFEVIIIDDCSTDDTPERARSVLNDFKGITYLRMPKNAGKPAALNLGVRKSHGKYLTVIDADDMREPDSLERLYRAQIKNPHKFIYDGIMAFYDGHRRPDYPIGVSAYDGKEILFHNHVPTGIMLPRSAWVECGGWPELMTTGREDWAMAINLGSHGYCGLYLPERGYLYRREQQNRTLKNTTPKHHQKFLAQLISLFPSVYKAGEVTMCCGNNSKSVKSSSGGGARTVRAAAIPLNGGSTILEYIGSSWGAQSFYGASGARYVAGKSRSLVKVDKNDLTGTTKKPGLLELRENGKLIFRVYNPPAAPAQKVVEPEPAPAPQEQETETVMVIEPQPEPEIAQVLEEAPKKRGRKAKAENG